MRKKQMIIGTLLTTLLAAGAAVAADGLGQYLDPELAPVFRPLPENVEVLRLENGLEVILMPNPGQPMAGIYTQVKVGSAREDYCTSGMSHMLEHLLFNGSTKYTQDELYELADQAGAYNNANTSDFYTNYMMVLPAANLETGLDLQSQMLFHSLIPVEKFEKEKGIVVGEIVQGRDRPGHFAESTLRQTLFADSSLDLPTVGTRSTIEHMVRDDVHAFYKRWYVPNNMVLTMAGNFDRDQAVGLLEQYYGQVAPGTIDSDRLRPAQLIERTTTVVRRGGDRRLLALSFEAPTYGMSEFFPFHVLTELLGLEGSGLLTSALADLPAEQRAELAVWWEKGPGFGRLTLEFELPETADPDRYYGLVQDALTGAVDTGIMGEDILGIVRMSETSTLLEREQLRMTGIYIAEPLVQGGTDFFLAYLERLREVTAEDVLRVMSNWLVDAPCLAVLIEPAAGAGGDAGGMSGGMQMPAGMQMPPAMVAALERQGGAGEAEEPASQATDVSAPPAVPVDRSVLPSGTVLVSQTTPGSPLMAVHLAARGRALVDRDLATAGAVDVVHRLLDEGFAGCDRTCFAQRLRSLGAVVKTVDDPRFPMDDYYTTGRFSFVRIECAAENGVEVLDLLAQAIRFAAFDDGDFVRVRDQRVTELSRKQASARSKANALLNDALCGDHPLHLPPEGDASSVGQLAFNQVRAVYRRAFAPENLVFAVVGPRAHADLKADLERLLPGQGTPTASLPPLPVTTTARQLRGSVGGQLTAIRLGAVVDVDAAEAAALDMAVAILSDRLGMDLRETRGLSYSVGASLELEAGQGRFTAWLNPPTERKDEGVAALREAVSGFAPASITQDELDRIRAARTGRLMMRRLSSLGRAYYLAMAELDGDIASYLNSLTAYDGLALTDVQAAAGKYLAGRSLIEVVVD